MLEFACGFGDVQQIAGYDEECRHVECIYYILCIRIFVAEIGKMEYNHQYNAETFDVVQFFQPFSHISVLCLSVINLYLFMLVKLHVVNLYQHCANLNLYCATAKAEQRV